MPCPIPPPAPFPAFRSCPAIASATADSPFPLFPLPFPLRQMAFCRNFCFLLSEFPLFNRYVKEPSDGLIHPACHCQWQPTNSHTTIACQKKFKKFASGTARPRLFLSRSDCPTVAVRLQPTARSIPKAFRGAARRLLPAPTPAGAASFPAQYAIIGVNSTRQPEHARCQGKLNAGKAARLRTK